VQGIKGDVDINVFAGSRQQWEEFIDQEESLLDSL
jgi:GH25 family lysozyme M1 (1,4-beta-N-acetylmuramidase)